MDNPEKVGGLKSFVNEVETYDGMENMISYIFKELNPYIPQEGSENQSSQSTARFKVYHKEGERHLILETGISNTHRGREFLNLGITIPDLDLNNLEPNLSGIYDLLSALNLVKDIDISTYKPIDFEAIWDAKITMPITQTKEYKDFLAEDYTPMTIHFRLNFERKGDGDLPVDKVVAMQISLTCQPSAPNKRPNLNLKVSAPKYTHDPYGKLPFVQMVQPSEPEEKPEEEPDSGEEVIKPKKYVEGSYAMLQTIMSDRYVALNKKLEDPEVINSEEYAKLLKLFSKSVRLITQTAASKFIDKQ